MTNPRATKQTSADTVECIDRGDKAGEPMKRSSPTPSVALIEDDDSLVEVIPALFSRRD